MMDRSMLHEWSFVVADSLEKIFVDAEPRAMNRSIGASVFVGETASFQVAFRPPSTKNYEELGSLRFSVDQASKRFVNIRRVELVPCLLVAFDGHDDGYVQDKAGMYPDLLRPAVDGVVAPLLSQWSAVWIDFRIDDLEHVGVHEITVTANSTLSERPLFESVVIIEVLPHELPALDIIHTEWFHCDGLADYYGVEVFSEEHWEIIERFLRKAVEMDMNSVLTPTWTPPLDTAVGGTRTPVQLVDVAMVNGAYQFGFTRLRRWMDLCQDVGIHTLEIAHLFTQWGAEKTPAIYVDINGVKELRFGWHVSAVDPEYRRFLDELLPRMNELFDREWSRDRIVYHISDEPQYPTMLDSYQAAKDVVSELLEGWTVVDAISSIEFYRSGAVPVPVVATDAVAPFLAEQVEPLWVYYCVGQNEGVANRFIGMPSLRNRVIGQQLFAHDIRGFLHWGFNFYNSFHSTHRIDPFKDVCAGGALLAGDAFVVYPGPDGEPLESVRFRVLAEAMADHRAMQLLRSLTGKESVMAIIDPDGTGAFDSIRYDPDFYREARERINRQIVAALGRQ